MSHPYSGAASYIYANEYQSPTQATHNILTGYDSQPATEKLYRDYQYQYPGAPAKTVELNFQVQSAHPGFGPGDPTRAALGHRKRAKASRQGAVTSPSTTIATLAFSPASQVSSLPSRTTSLSRTSHSHSYSHAYNAHPHIYSHTHTHSRSSSRNNPNHLPQPPNHYTTPTSDRPSGYNSYYDTPSHPDPIAYNPRPTPKQPKPKPPKLTLRTRFKLTLPNPFRQSSPSSWPPRSPTTNRRPGSPPPSTTVASRQRSRPSSNFWDWSSSPKKGSRLSRWLFAGRKYAMGGEGKKKKSLMVEGPSRGYHDPYTSRGGDRDPLR